MIALRFAFRQLVNSPGFTFLALIGGIHRFAK